MLKSTGVVRYAEVRKMYEDLEVPSDPRVTVSQIKGFIQLLPKLGREFSRNSAESLPGAPGKSNLPRILSYLKYLGILTESRVRSGKDSEESIQRFTLTDFGKALYYHVESGRQEEFAKTWKGGIQSLPVFEVVYQAKFAQHPKLTMNELQDMVYESKNRSVSATWARAGAEFLASLYADAGLVEYDVNGEKLTLAPGVAGTTDTPKNKPTGGHDRPKFELESFLGAPASLRSTADSSADGRAIPGSFEEYSSKEIYIKLVPTPRNIAKARAFLDMITPEPGDGGAAGARKEADHQANGEPAAPGGG